ncbi:pentatricopeptide repeat-containing protein mitochondrial-like [Gossypium australe]|uniref:Pentatricopeptide repeat-containing protein mitochondrial-like n=1 Tax=Gossypium australe TaxID=47621 RepID=A0A5B6VWY0_9ROSI|nr:pentatricopeptide repeat-containing protein mitochondrial-like [Gossypium australe]
MADDGSDPLLTKEIFDVATTQPSFHHSYSSFLVLIPKLNHSKHFSLVNDLLVRLKFDQYRVTPTLFSYLIKIYTKADLVEKALNVFYKMLEFNIKLLPKHLNRILELLVSHCNFIMLSFDLFKTAHKYVQGLCRKSQVNRDIDLLEDMLNKGFIPDSLSYTTLLNSLCRKKKLKGVTMILCIIMLLYWVFVKKEELWMLLRFLNNHYSGRNHINY